MKNEAKRICKFWSKEIGDYMDIMTKLELSIFLSLFPCKVFIVEYWTNNSTKKLI